MELLDRKRACAYLGVCPNTLTALVKGRKVAYAKIGGKYVFDRADLDEYIQQVKVPARRATKIARAIDRAGR